MRIAHVISSLKRGGAETVLASLITHPLFDTDEHHVIFFHDGPLKEKLYKKNIKIHHISYSPLFFIRFFYTLYTIKPDSIHALLWFSMTCSALAGFFLRIPVVGVFHNNIDQNSAYKNYIDWFVLRLLKQYAAVSESVADGVCAYHTWLDRSRITIIHNGIDLPPTIAPLQRSYYNLPKNAVVIGSVGRFEEVKRYPWLIDRFAELCMRHDNIYLLLIGTGSQELQLRNYVQAKKMKNKVRLIVNQNAYTLYHLCDIFTLTSKKEGLSIALLEAMSYGISPIITHEGSENHPIITQGYDGFIIPPDDSLLFCSQMKRLIDAAALRNNVGKNALKTVRERFSRDNMVSNYKILFMQRIRSTI